MEPQQMVTLEQAKAMADAAVEAERQRIRAGLDGIAAGLKLAETMARLEQRAYYSAPRRQPKRDGIDRAMSILTFGVW